MTNADVQTLFTNALDVTNSALDRHREEVPYAQILASADKMLDGRKLGVAVYESEAGSPFDYFTIRYHDGRLELVSHGKEEPDAQWKVSRAYLQEVAEHPQTYIEHPIKLDLAWLKDRVGLA